MSWMFRGADERLVRAMRGRRDVLRGPLAPGTGARDASEGVLGRAFGVTMLFMIIMVVLLAAATAYYAAYSGALRWMLYALVVGIVGFVAIRVVGATVVDPARLGSRAPVATGRAGDLTYLRTTLHRAQGGLAYSQLVFEDRLREAFLERVRVLRDVPEHAILTAMRDPGALQAILGDRDLTLFVLESARNSRGYPATVRVLPKRTEFAGRVRGLLERMEAWR